MTAFPLGNDRFEIASEGGELVYSSASSTAFIDARTWPPAVVRHAANARHAARLASGRWLLACDDHVLRWYPSIAAPTPEREEPVPIPARDLALLIAQLPDVERRIATRDTARVEALHACGELAIAVPRQIGLGGVHHPYVLRDGRWAEDLSIPAFSKTDPAARCQSQCVRLTDGTDLLVWDGHVLVARDDRFEPWCERRFELASFLHRELVASLDGGVFAVDPQIRLVEIRPGGELQVHLPSTRVSALRRGPDGTLVVNRRQHTQLYEPRTRMVAALAAVVANRTVVGTTSGGALIAQDTRADALHVITAAQLAELPRVAGDVEPAPPPPVAPLDGLGAAARARLAVAGDQLVLCRDDELRYHERDTARGIARVGAPIVAVARTATHVAALDRDGTLHVFDGDRRVLAAVPIGAEPRALVATPAGGWLAITASGCAIADAPAARIERVGVPGAIIAAADPEGAIVIVASDRRLALYERGTLEDIPEAAEQIVAIAALGNRRFACAGERNLFLLDLRERELVSLDRRNVSPWLAASPSGRMIAWAGPTAVAVGELTGTTLSMKPIARYGSKFINPPDAPLAVEGLAFLDDNRLVVALTGARGNLLHLADQTAQDLDPQPGEPPSRWLVMFMGQLY